MTVLEFEKMTVDYIDPKKLRIFDYSRKLFPPLQGEAYEYLKQDIQENGIRTPLEVTKEGIILCGHERHRVALDLGLKEVPIIRFNDGSEVDQKIHLIKDNLARKAVDEETRAECAVELDILYGMKQGSPVPYVNTPKGEDTEKLSQEQIAETLDVSERSIQRGKRIKLSNLPEEIKHAAFHGPLTLRAIDDLLRKSKQVQELAIPKIMEKLNGEDDFVSVQKITSEIEESLATKAELEKVGVPCVDTQVEEFYGKIKPQFPKNQMPKPTSKSVIQAILKLLESNDLKCPICGENHLQWRCGHELK